MAQASQQKEAASHYCNHLVWEKMQVHMKTLSVRIFEKTIYLLDVGRNIME